MYVRIARFENASGDWDERIEVRKRMSGEVDSPMAQARDAVTRAMMPVDRENNRGAGVIFCETEDDLRRVDQAMNEMSPPSGAGTRTSVEVYEVAVDEQPAQAVPPSGCATAPQGRRPVRKGVGSAPAGLRFGCGTSRRYRRRVARPFRVPLEDRLRGREWVSAQARREVHSAVETTGSSRRGRSSAPPGLVRKYDYWSNNNERLADAGPSSPRPLRARGGPAGDGGPVRVGPTSGADGPTG